jgi:hypothetical protein
VTDKLFLPQNITIGKVWKRSAGVELTLYSAAECHRFARTSVQILAETDRCLLAATEPFEKGALAIMTRADA